VNIVVPMAGRGSRLAGHDSGRPKPLIAVGGRPLWAWAVHCLPLATAERVVFVCLQEHIDRYGLDRAIREELTDLPVRIVALDDVTDGQLRTVVAAEGELDLDASLLVYNADTWFRHDASQFLGATDRHDGLLGVARKPGDRWSFARLGDDGLVVEVAEKTRISDLACTGLYWFRDTSRFLADAASMFRAQWTTKGEYFVAPLYEEMIARGDRVGVVEAAEFLPIGTPEELDSFRHFQMNSI
jgi:NDP-sugar pyrophosphorylase family protein